MLCNADALSLVRPSGGDDAPDKNLGIAQRTGPGAATQDLSAIIVRLSNRPIVDVARHTRLGLQLVETA